MVDARFLSRLGLFVKEDFLSAHTCAEYINLARQTPATRAMVADGDKIMLDEETRRTYDVHVGNAAKEAVYSTLLSVRSDLENHFGVQLKDCIYPAFLSYRVGDFFHRHPDNTGNADLPESIKRRKVSVVVFLNDHDEQNSPETFAGGELTFYGLMSDPRLENKGLPLRSKAGLLVAFRSDLKHEVRPVTHGERFTVVSWFY